MPKKYYAVKAGLNTGIYESWTECQAQISGYKGAEFKGFPTRAAAVSYLGGAAEDEHALPEDSTLFAYVDGSFNAQTNVYGYGVVLIFSDGKTVQMNGSGEDEKAVSMRNVSGELKGAIMAMQYAVNHQFRKLTIFHDYEGVAKWARREWKANLELTKAYVEFCQKIGNVIEIAFVKVLAHSGVVYNEMADQLAKEGAGICIQ